jgi:hypothetical protein
MSATNNMALSRWLFDPFTYVAGTKALTIGLVGIVLAGFLGSLGNTHFDGVLDAHTAATASPTYSFFVEGFVDWICLAGSLLMVGRILSQTQFRTIDLAGTQALARFPTVFVSLIGLSGGYQRFSNNLINHFLKHSGDLELSSQDAFIFGVVILGVILFTCWMVFLMYKSYSTVCNLGGQKAVLTFVLALIVAETASKAALHWLMKWS